MIMKRYCLAVLLLVLSFPLWAEEGRQIPAPALANAPVDPDDFASIKRGAKFFSTNCMTCHTLIYLRYDKLAAAEGITYEKMPINVKSWPYGVKPPDLSLEASIKGVDWIYTYLHSFYKDPARPTGVNNLVFPNTAMPDMVAAYQGEQELVENPLADLFHHYQWYDLVKLTRQGSMSPEEFDAAMTDVVNFLAYAAEPYHQEQHRIGWWVLGFLSILLVMMVCLKREYWKDVKRHRDEK